MNTHRKIQSPVIAKETCRLLYSQMQEIMFLEEVSYVCLKNAIRHIELSEQGVPQITRKTMKDLKLLWEFLRSESELAKANRDFGLATVRKMQATEVSRIGTYLKEKCYA